MGWNGGTNAQCAMDGTEKKFLELGREEKYRSLVNRSRISIQDTVPVKNLREGAPPSHPLEKNPFRFLKVFSKWGNIEVGFFVSDFLNCFILWFGFSFEVLMGVAIFSSHIPAQTAPVPSSKSDLEEEEEDEEGWATASSVVSRNGASRAHRPPGGGGVTAAGIPTGGEDGDTPPSPGVSAGRLGTLTRVGGAKNRG